MDLSKRILHLQNLCIQYNVDAILMSSPSHISYLTDYWGFVPDEREAWIFVTKKHAYLMSNALYIEELKNKITHLSLIEQTATNPLVKVLSTLCVKEKMKTIGFEGDNLTYSEYTYFQKNLSCSFVPVSLGNIRSIKTEDEIERIRYACNIGDKAFTYILSQIKENITEEELSSLLKTFILKQKAACSFEPVIAFGENSSIPHHNANDTKLKKKTIVLMDFGVKKNGYCSDMTRTVFFGNPSKEEKEVYDTVRISQEKAIQALQENVPLLVVDKVSRDYILSKNFPSIPHSLGHGIGIEVHESPYLSLRSNDLLTDGMVFSIEPGIYLPNKFGVRIEDIFAFQNHAMQLTTSQSEIIVL